MSRERQKRYNSEDISGNEICLLGVGDRVGWRCSLEFEMIHISLFDSGVRLSLAKFIQTAKLRVGTGEYLFP